MMSAKKFGLIITAIVVGFIGLVAVAKVNAPETANTTKSSITASDAAHDFGDISMKDGNVTYETDIQNTSDKQLNIKKLHTSCMCTKVTLTTEGKTYGPFGMEGHGGTVPGIEVALAPGQTGKLKVEFDPAAHGSAGIGLIERSIYVDTFEEPRAEFEFKASVAP